MQFRPKKAGYGLLVVALLAASGCGRKDGPPAGINGPALGNPQGGAESQPATPVAPSSDRQHPRVVMETSLGSITIELDAAKVPATVNNFLNYVDHGFYDQTIFHQVVKDHILVAGGFDVKMQEKRPRAAVYNEAAKSSKHCRGAIAMVRQPDAMDSASSQFFFDLCDNPQLEHKDDTAQGYGYCVFGQVVAGDDVLDRIAKVPVHTAGQFEQTPVEPVVINSIRRMP